MKISFFGHSDFVASDAIRKKLLSVLLQAADEDNEFYFGGYGNFDTFAYSFVKKLFLGKAKLLFVTPYITESYQKNSLAFLKDKYDEIIYPPLEKVPYRYAISARNEWMVEQSELIITYINHPWGGAYKAYLHSKKSAKNP